MKKIKNNKGITLTALIITMIVMLILAGVVFWVSLRNNGLVKNVSAGTKRYNSTKALEELQSVIHQWKIDKYMGKYKTLKQYLEDFEYDVFELDNNRYKVHKDGYYFTIDKDLNITLDEQYYNISLKTPNVTIKKDNEVIQETQITNSSLIVEFGTQDSKENPIEYEISITRYSLNEPGLLNSDGTINKENVKNAGNEARFEKIQANEHYTKETENKIKVENSGIYKIKVKSTTNEGVIKSEETVSIIAIDKVTREGLVELQTEDENVYEEDTWTNKKVKITLNTDSDVAYGNKNVTYTLTGQTTQTETSLTSKTIATIENDGETQLTIKIKIGSIIIINNYNIKICKQHEYGEYIIVNEADCVNDGLKYRLCQKCSNRLDETVLALGHKELSTYSKDTQGHWKECERCGQVMVEKEEHNMVSGECTYKKCSVCDYSVGSTSHSWSYGECDYKYCTKCGKSSGSTSHVWTSGTCTYKYCSYCGASSGTSTHSWSYGTCTYKKCNNCGTTSGSSSHDKIYSGCSYWTCRNCSASGGVKSHTKGIPKGNGRWQCSVCGATFTA